MNFVLSPFEGNINTVDSQGLNLYLQATKEIYKESYKIDIQFSNSEEIIDHFISLAHKYGWGRLSFLVRTGAGKKNILRHVGQIKFWICTYTCSDIFD